MATARDRSRSPRGASTEDIVKLVVSREQARNAKEWATADSLRDQLQAIGVQLQDKTKNWQCQDGRTGRIPTWQELEGGGPQVTESMVMQASGGGLTMMDTSEQGQIKALVSQREQARAAKDYTKSDQLREELKAMGVDLLDKEKLWKSKAGLQGIIVGYGGLNPTDTEVQTLVMQREKARSDKNFDTADMIREELKKVGVDINDKDKIWRSADGHSGQVPAWAQINPASNLAMLPMQSMLPLQPMQPMRRGIFGGRAQAIISQPLMARPVQQIGKGMQPQWGRPPPPAPAVPLQKPEVQEAMAFIGQASGRAVSEGEIMWLVELREKCRQNKDFNSSDELRNAMREQLGIEFFEKEKRWQSKDGLQGSIPMWS